MYICLKNTYFTPYLLKKLNLNWLNKIKNCTFLLTKQCHVAINYKSIVKYYVILWIIIMYANIFDLCWKVFNRLVKSVLNIVKNIYFKWIYYLKKNLKWISMRRISKDKNVVFWIICAIKCVIC